jgi:hypothetical protein
MQKAQHFLVLPLADKSATCDFLVISGPLGYKDNASRPSRRSSIGAPPWPESFVSTTPYLRLQPARSVGVSVAELLRPAIDQAADPRSGYVYTTQTTILSGVIQTLAIVAASIRRRSPETLEEGMADAKQMLNDRGLLPPEERS